MKKIIVTGGLGFIGSNLVKMLLQKKYFVINIDKIAYSSNFYNIKEFENHHNYRFIKLDIIDRKLKKVFFNYKPTCIFNLAAETHVDRSIDSPGDFVKTNIVGVYNLLECFKEFSKAASDHLVASYFKTYKIPAIITNCSNNYGPNQHPEKLIPKLIHNIIKNKSLPIYGNGNNSREWIHVEDHCDALIKIFKNGENGECYNIGSNQDVTNIEVCKNLIKIARTKIKLGKNVKINFVKDRPGHDWRYALNSKKIIKKLKWKPKINFIDGLNKTFDWYLKNPKYYNSFNKKDMTKRQGLNK